MGVERLPDLNVPRGCHRTLVLNGEITLLGGNTTGFKPIVTAEYYADGAWHTVSMLYSHMNGFDASLPDGSVLLGGGSPEAFGVGQSWGTEIYDPATHSFSASGMPAWPGYRDSIRCQECSASPESTTIRLLTEVRHRPHSIMPNSPAASLPAARRSSGNRA